VISILPRWYAGTVRIAVELDGSSTNAMGGPSAFAPHDPWYLGTEIERIKSKQVLYPVIEQLDLSRRWGDRFNGGVLLRTAEVYELLSRRVEVDQVRSTTLVQIQVYSDDRDKPAEEAAEIANTIAAVYRDSTTAQARRVKVEIVDPAEPALRPARPNVMLNIGAVLSAGTLLGVIAGGVLFLLLRPRSQDGPTPPPFSA